MALSNIVKDGYHGKAPAVLDAYFVAFGSFNLGTSYTTGGVPIGKSDMGFAVVLEHIELSQAGGRTYEFDKTNSKIKAYRNAAGAGDLAEVANATDLSAVSIRFMAIGK
ncbi:MAG TPA: hypothetical protein VIM33_07545 [Gaiellaceae bacterium]|jgi:hypothetical protein